MKYVSAMALSAATAGFVMGWAPEARAQLGVLDTDPPEAGEPCATFSPSEDESLGSNQLQQHNATALREAERECLLDLGIELEKIDDSTEWFSAASIVGALGAVASGLTGQSVGTMNAWLGVGLSPVVADDIRQRPQIEEIYVGVRQNLLQMQCRSTFLERHYSYLSWKRSQLSDNADSLLAHLITTVDERPNLMSATTDPNLKLRRIVEEGFRVVGEARRLARRIDFIPDAEEIVLLEQAAYNNIVGEMAEALRARNLSPLNAFRGVLAAPFRATATFLAPEGNGAPPNYASVIQSRPVDLNAAFRLRLQSIWTTPSSTWVGGGIVPNYYEVPTGRDRVAAQAIEAATAELLTLGIQVEDDLTIFVGLARESGDFCPGELASDQESAGQPLPPVSPPPPPPVERQGD